VLQFTNVLKYEQIHLGLLKLSLLLLLKLSLLLLLKLSLLLTAQTCAVFIVRAIMGECYSSIQPHLHSDARQPGPSSTSTETSNVSKPTLHVKPMASRNGIFSILSLGYTILYFYE